MDPKLFDDEQLDLPMYTHLDLTRMLQGDIGFEAIDADWIEEEEIF